MRRGSTLEQMPVGADGQREAIDNARQTLGTIILGKDEEISLALACLLARGHLLIEDLPGLGKTTLAQALAKVLGLTSREYRDLETYILKDIESAFLNTDYLRQILFTDPGLPDDESSLPDDSK